MNFYYYVNRRTADAFSMSNFRSLYRKACGNHNCTSTQNTPWTSLRDAANSVWGQTSTKAIYWRNMGDAFGVDH